MQSGTDMRVYGERRCASAGKGFGVMGCWLLRSCTISSVAKVELQRSPEKIQVTSY
jgi:hypothetical protein